MIKTILFNPSALRAEIARLCGLASLSQLRFVYFFLSRLDDSA